MKRESLVTTMVKSERGKEKDWARNPRLSPAWSDVIARSADGNHQPKGGGTTPRLDPLILHFPWKLSSCVITDQTEGKRLGMNCASSFSVECPADKEKQASARSLGSAGRPCIPQVKCNLAQAYIGDVRQYLPSSRSVDQQAAGAQVG